MSDVTRKRTRKAIKEEGIGVAKNVIRRGNRKCKICNDANVRVLVMEMVVQGYKSGKIRDEIRRNFGTNVGIKALEKHINEHEKGVAPWVGLVRYKFGGEEERKKFESAFLAKISLVLELWDKYCVLSELFELVVGKQGNVNPSIVGRPKVAADLAGQMKDYLVELMRLQKERDVVVEVAKVVLYMLADRLVSRLHSVVGDLPVERREIIGSILKEEVRSALDYAKDFAKEKVEDMMKKVKDEYSKLVGR